MSWKQLWGNGWAFLRARYYLRHATSIGKRVRLYGKASIINEGNLIVGERVQLVSTIVPIELVASKGGTLTIGNHVFVNYGCSISAQMQVTIGNHCQIGTYVMMLDNDFHRLETERRLERPPSAPIILEENVWVGGKATILSGVRIGAGSVIGANSVVTKDIPPRSLAVGMPARVIRTL